MPGNIQTNKYLTFHYGHYGSMWGPTTNQGYSCTSPCTLPCMFLLVFLGTYPCLTLYPPTLCFQNGQGICMFPHLSMVHPLLQKEGLERYGTKPRNFGGSNLICSLAMQYIVCTSFPHSKSTARFLSCLVLVDNLAMFHTAVLR